MRGFTSHLPTLATSLVRRSCYLALAWLTTWTLGTQTACAQAPGWSTDVGAVGTPGDSSYDPASGAYQLAGGGAGLAGTADAFHFAYYQIVQGDGQIVVRLGSADAQAQAALVVRASLAPGASSAAVTVHNGVAQFVRRLATGQESIAGAATGVNVPGWLKLVRTGGLVSAFVSADGQAWTSLGSDTLDLGTSTLYTGLAVSNAGVRSAQAATATFDGVRSTFLPDQGLVLWLKADAGLAADTTEAVSAWADQSGHGHNALQTNAAQRPQVVPNAVGAPPVVRFDGSHSFLQLPVGFEDFSGGLTALVVARPTGSTTVGHVLDLGTGTTGDHVFLACDGSNGALRYHATHGRVAEGSVSDATGVSVLDAWQLLEVVHGSTGVATMYKDGVQIAQEEAGAIEKRVRTDNFVGKGQGDGHLFQGNIAEILLFKHALNDAERQSWEAYLSAKYGSAATPLLAGTRTEGRATRQTAAVKTGPQPQAVTSAPTGLTAVPGNAQVSLTWNAVTGATSYSVKRATTSGGPYTAIKTGLTTASYVATSLTNGTTYYFVVSATNADGESANSAQASATPTAPPAIPTGLIATPGNAQVVLSWTAVSGATGYTVKRATTSGGPYTNVQSALTATTFTNTGLTNGTLYYFVVSATNVGGESANSSQVSATPAVPPAAPASLVATPGNAQVTLSWNAASGAASYTIKRATTSGGPYASVKTGQTTTSYANTGLTNGTAYYFVVSAVGSTGVEGAPSAQVSATPAVPPAAPSNLVAAPGNAQVALAWGAVSGAASYTVQRATTSGGPYTTIKTGLTTAAYTDAGLANGTTYYYVVGAVGPTGVAGANSAQASAKPVAPPGATTGVSATRGNAQVTLAWSAVSGASGYSVKRATTSGGPYSTVKTGQTATNYSDGGLTNGTTYYYVISASNAGGESPNSAQVSAMPMAPPTAPTGMAAVAGNAQAALSWNAVTSASSYSIKRATTSGGPYTAIKTGQTAPTYADSGLTNGTTYYYVVSASNTGGESANSSQASATPVSIPLAPTALTATPGNAQVSLSWTAVSGATSYSIKRATSSGGPYTTIKTGQTTASYASTGLTNGTTYYFVVSATNAAGEGSNSSQVSATPVAPPTAPSGLSANPGNSQATLSWTAVAGAASYSVSGSTVSGGPYTLLQNGLAATTYTQTGLTNGTTYYYVVSATNAGGTSANSAPTSATPHPPLVAPTGLNSVAYSDVSATMTWDAVAANSGATAYSIYRNGVNVGSTPLASSRFTDTALAPASSNVYTVRAQDVAGNQSGNSASLTIITATSNLPSSWQHQEIGQVGLAGTATSNAGVYVVKGAGADIAGTSDHFHYLYQSLTGNGQIIAHVASMDNTDALAKAGIMIRSQLTPDSPCAAVCLTPSSGALWMYRTTAAGATTTATATGVATPNWVKLVRNGSTLQGYWSANGTSWTSLGSKSITMASNVYVGFAVCSRLDTTLCAAAFDTVTTVSGDSDNDGLPDAWEIQYFGTTTAQTGSGDADGDGKTNFQEFQAGTDPTDYYNGQTFNLQIVSGDAQGGPPGGTFGLPLVVKVLNGSGTVAGNAPVTFTPSAGLVGTAAAGPFMASVTVRTSTSTGQATVYYQAPNTLASSSTILAKQATGSGTGQVSFQAFTNELPNTNMKFWLRADRGVTLDASGLVSTWRDQSGQGNNATQSSASARPLLVPGAVGGKPALFFDGVSYRGGHSTVLNLPNCMSSMTQGAILAVVQPGLYSYQPQQGIWTMGGTQYYGDRFGTDYGSGESFYGGVVFSYPDEQEGVRAEQHYIYYAQSQPGLFMDSVNGRLFSSTTNHTIGFPTTPRIGESYQNYFYYGHIAEIIVYSQAPSDADLQTAYAYLNGKYHFTTQLTKPTHLQVTPGALANSIQLNWDEYLPENFTTSFAIERQTGAGAFVQVAVLSDQTSYLDTGLSPGQTYTYRLRALELGAYSDYSAQFTLTLGAITSSVPTTGLQLWLRADAGVTKDVNNGISAWYDQSGNNHHATQSEAANRPEWVTAAPGQPAAVHFVHKGQDAYSPPQQTWLTLPNFLTAQTAGEVFVVQRADPPEPYDFDGYDDDDLFDLGPVPSNNSYDSFGSTIAHRASSLPQMRSGFHVYNAAASGQAWSNRVDGIAILSAESNQVAWSNAPRLGYGYTGNFGEVLVYDHVLADAERQQVQAYLNVKYAIASIPAVPAAPTITTLSPTQVHLGWKGSLDSAGYRIERKLSTDAAFQQIGDVYNTLSYVDTSLPPGAQAQYRIIAYNLAGSSSYSTVVSVSLPTQGQSVPLNDLAVWYKEDAGVITDGNAAVLEWLDQSGGNFPAISYVPNAPTLATDQLNGESVMRFDGVKDTLHFFVGSTSLTQAEVYVVQQAAQAFPDQDHGFWQMGGPAANQTNYPAGNGTLSDGFGSRDLHSIGTPTKRVDQFRLYNASSQDNLWICRLDTAEQYRTTTNTFQFGLVDSVAYGQTLGIGGSQYFAGDVAEVMVFNRVLSDPERHAVENYLMIKYALIDSDGDGMPDWWEKKYFGDLSHNGTADTDGDGLSDLAEYQHGTNPTKIDTDGDGMSDGFEVAHGLNPTKNDALKDFDGDGIPNYLDADPSNFNVGSLQVTITVPANHSVVHP